MDRRTVLRNITYITVGSIILPACMQNENRTTTELKNLKITGDQENMLADLTQTILPSLNGNGAKELQSHLFALIMIDDCSSPEEQQKFILGMKNFEDTVKDKYHTSFVKCSADKKNELLKSLEEKKYIPEEVQTFYRTIKKLTVQSYTTSKDYMEKIAGYKMVPGIYRGSVPVSQQA